MKVMKQNRIVKASPLLCLCTHGGSVLSGPGHFPSARAIQELVQAWNQMRKWR